MTARQPGCRSPAALVFAIAALAVLLTGCRTAIGAGGGEVPAGARLENAVVLEDPHSYVGPSSARLAEPGLRPVADNPEQSLPVTVTDSQGTEVTITDTSRILALDIYGTSSRVIFELGLGNNIVGRDTSSAFPEILERPLVTQNGHDHRGHAMESAL